MPKLERLLSRFEDRWTGGEPTIQASLLVANAREVGRMLGLSIRTIRAMDSAGKLPRPIRFGRAVRWRVSEIQDWVDEGSPDRERWEMLKDIRSLKNG